MGSGLTFAQAFFAGERFFRAPVICFRARALTVRFVLKVAAATASSSTADVGLGGLPRRLPRLPRENRSMVLIASSICCRSARRLASILRMSMPPSITPRNPANAVARTPGASLPSRDRPSASRSR
jgi:hypothetical protein